MIIFNFPCNSDNIGLFPVNMDLSDYKRRFGATYTHIAQKCNVSPATISQVAAGSHTPSFKLAVAIEEATGGRVSRTNWFPPPLAVITITIGATSL